MQGQDHPNAESELQSCLQRFARGRSADVTTLRAQRAFYDAVRLPIERTVKHELMFFPELVQLAVQETWGEIFNAAPRFDPARGGVLSWVKGIALNCARRTREAELKSRRLIQHPAASSEESDEEHATDWALDQACPLPGPEQLSYAQQQQRAIASCLERLPADGRVPYRQAFELSVDSDLSYKALASLLSESLPQHSDCSEEQVRKWVTRASEKMRQCLSVLLGQRIAGAE